MEFMDQTQVQGICFGINASFLRDFDDTLSEKTQAFSTIVPGVKSTYRFKKSQREYYDEYAKSYYAFTQKKAGWDCMRHYEILAAGAIPYFLDLHDAPSSALHNFPRELVQQAMALPGVSQEGTIDFDVFPKREYVRLRLALRQHTVAYLTTQSVAKEFVSKLNGAPKSVLFLSSSPRPDYLRCSLLAGLKSVLGATNVLDAIKVPHIYETYPPNLALKLYGNGFSYTRVLPEDPDLDRSPLGVEAAIRAKKYDVVVYGSMYRGLPYLDLVKANYPPNRIVFVFGEDSHKCRIVLPGSTYFIRELHLFNA